jgi:hypothetical protein
MEPLTSPLKVRQKKSRVWAENASGGVVVDGNNRDQYPDPFSCEAFGGTWRILAVPHSSDGSYFPVLDPAGNEAARVGRVAGQKGWSLSVPNGDSGLISAKGGGLVNPFSCDIEGWATAVAPRFAPQRYWTLTLSPAALSHPSAQAIAVVSVWQGEAEISNAIVNSNIGGY